MNYRVPLRAAWVILLVGIFIAGSASAAAGASFHGDPPPARKSAVHFRGIEPFSVHPIPAADSLTGTPSPLPLKLRCTDAAFPLILLLLLIYHSGLKRK